ALCQAKFPHVALESMEGAAVFYACAQEELPCIQVRAISNYVEQRDKSSWKIDLAITNLNNWLQKFIRENYYGSYKAYLKMTIVHGIRGARLQKYHFKILALRILY